VSRRPRGSEVLAVLAPSVLLAVDPSGWYWFGPVKWAAVTVLLPVGCALLVHRSPVRIVRAPTTAAIALVVIFAIAAAGGLDPLYAWTGTPERHLGVITWALCVVALVAGQSVPDDDRHLVGIGVAVAGCGMGGLAVAEALGWEPLVFDVGRRLTASLGSSAYLGAATALLLPPCVGLVRDRGLARPARWIAAIAVPALVVATLGSGARAAWVGLGLSGVITAIARREVLIERPGAVIAAIALLAVLGAGVLALTPVGPRVASTFDAGEPGGSGRLDEWRVAARVVVDHPVLGVGPEGYRIAFADGVDDAYEREHGRDPLPDRAHAAPLDIALAGGVPALLAWLTFLGFAARHVWRALRGERAWLAGLAAGLLAYQVGQMLLFPIGEIEPVVWLLAGIVISATARPSERLERVASRTVAGALVAFATIALVAGGLDVAADRSARKAVDALASGATARAYDAAKDASARRPDEVRLHLLEAQAAIEDQRGSLVALEAVSRALDRSHDDPVARLERATLLVARAQATLVPDHIDHARGEVDNMVRHDPHNAELLLLAGQAARLDGDVPAAIDAWTRAEQLAPRRAAPAASLALLHLEQGQDEDAQAAAERALAIDPDDDAALEVLRRLEAEG
jgi:O-antigen ligase